MRSNSSVSNERRRRRAQEPLPFGNGHLWPIAASLTLNVAFATPAGSFVALGANLAIQDSKYQCNSPLGKKSIKHDSESRNYLCERNNMRERAGHEQAAPGMAHKERIRTFGVLRQEYDYKILTGYIRQEELLTACACMRRITGMGPEGGEPWTQE